MSALSSSITIKDEPTVLMPPPPPGIAKKYLKTLNWNFIIFCFSSDWRVWFEFHHPVPNCTFC